MEEKAVSLAATLSREFPATAFLLGKEMMAEVAKNYAAPVNAQDNPLSDFPFYLRRLSALRDYPYVADIAALEYAAQRATLSPVLPALTPQDLEAIKDPLNMQLYVQPHVHLLRAGWPVDKLWADIQSQGSALSSITLAPQESFIVVYRARNGDGDDDGAAIWPVGECGYALLENLQLNPAFAFAAEAALRAQADGRLDLAMAESVARGLFARKPLKPAKR